MGLTPFRKGQEPPRNLYQISTTDPPLIFYGSSLAKAHKLFISLLRLIPPDSLISLARVEPVVGRHTTPWSTVIWDKARFTRSHKCFTYNGPRPTVQLELDTATGRAHQFTPKEKHRTVRFILTNYPFIDEADLIPLTDYMLMRRSEVPLGRELARAAGRLGRPRNKPLRGTPTTTSG